MTAAIQFGSRTIDFRLEYSDRKSLGITVTPEMEVLVKAPAETSMEKVKEKLEKKHLGLLNNKASFFPFNQRHRTENISVEKLICIWADNTACKLKLVY